MPLVVEQTTQRPPGHSISYTQASKNCDLELRWHRERVRQSHLGASLLYGRALHNGIEAFMHQRVFTAAQAVQVAKAYVSYELGSPYRDKQPIRWDEKPERRQDGQVALSPKGNYGRLSCQQLIDFWLERQIPLWLNTYGHLKILRSEHQIFVPLTPQPDWKNPWSIEAWLDLEFEGDLIVDVKSTGDPWDDRDFKKNSMQGLLYMACYRYRYGKLPRFVFHVLPRSWDKDQGGPALRIDEKPVVWDKQRVQRYIDGVIRRKVSLIEAGPGAMAAAPGGWWCDPSWCSYYEHHCAFGKGNHL